MDIILMPLFRFPDEPVTGFFLGTFLLASASVLIGKYSMAAAFRFNRDTIHGYNREMEYYQKMSLRALKAGNKAAYKACNGIANNAYGKFFFSQIALAASFLWPAFLALGWMQYRFSGVEFSLPAFDQYGVCSYGYVSTFLVCYVSARLLNNAVRKLYPHLNCLSRFFR